MRVEDTGFYKQLLEIAPNSEILLNEPMSAHTTFRVGGEADIFVNVADVYEASAIIKYLNISNNEYFILGRGSNLLVGDKGYRGTVVSFGKLNEIKIEGNLIYASAGASLAKIAAVALDNSLTGFEFAAGIPGTLGGAVTMNAGAYGGEMKQVIKSVDVITSSGEIITLSNEEMQFAYRDSILKHKSLVCTGAVIELTMGDKIAISEKMKELSEARKSKQPLEYPSAGSTFKRPEGYFAGKLIMDAGLSGYTIGGASVSSKHCGFIINSGNASAADVKDLIDEVREKVEERFGVTLEPEVCMLGEF